MIEFEDYDFYKECGLLRKGVPISKSKAEDLALRCSYILKDIYDDGGFDKAPTPEEAKVLREIIMFCVRGYRMPAGVLELLIGDSEEVDQAVYRNLGANKEIKKQLEERFKLYGSTILI